MNRAIEKVCSSNSSMIITDCNCYSVNDRACGVAPFGFCCQRSVTVVKQNSDISFPSTVVSVRQNASPHPSGLRPGMPWVSKGSNPSSSRAQHAASLDGTRPILMATRSRRHPSSWPHGHVDTHPHGHTVT